MQREFEKKFGIPEIDFLALARPVSAEEEEAAYQAFLNQPKHDWRKFVEEAEKHPEMLSVWDMSISFEEFARRVRAGEYD